jgi:tetratricopeptide (TPR) repeat protein
LLARTGESRHGAAIQPQPAEDRPVKAISTWVRLTTALGAVVALLAVPSVADADTASDFIPKDLPVTFAGSYLAGRSADIAEDLGSAVTFYAEALSADPANPALSERLLLLSLAGGDMEKAAPLAERLVEMDSGNPVARLMLASRLIKEGHYDKVADTFAPMAPAPLASLSAGLLTAWAQYGEGKVDDAIKTIDGLSGPSWYGIFKDYHTALILDAAGRETDALDAIKHAYDTDATALRIVESYALINARAGHKNTAIKALTDFGGEQPLHPLIASLLKAIRAGDKLTPLAPTAAAGAAEALYGLGSAIGTDQGPELPAAYLRLATYLDPTADMAIMATGDVFQSAQRCDTAIPIYDSVAKSSPIRRNADLQIGHCLQRMDKPEEAAAKVESVLDADPGDVEAAVELGNIYRANSEFAKAADAYTRGVEAIGQAQPDDWRIFYFRGVAYERSKQWPKAEADFHKALELNPEQPQVLNYLGYSWVDMGTHLSEALDMIKAAVKLRPNDGYIVDSLGWAYFKLGRFQDAVDELEQAVSLQADDPIINEHLGDAYWKVGRKLEATFQWAHARDLNPDKSDLPVILAKLEHGLKDPPAEPPAAKANDARNADGNADTNVAAVPPADALPASVTVAPGDSLWSIANRIYGNSDLYLLIYKANRDRIRDPDLIFPGMTLNIPAAATN